MTVVKMDINRGVSDDKFVLEQPEGTSSERSASGLSPAPPPAKSEEEEKSDSKLVLENLKHQPDAQPAEHVADRRAGDADSVPGRAEPRACWRIRRGATRGIGADIMVRPNRSPFLTLSGAPIDEKSWTSSRKQPHVALATGIIVQPLAEPFSSAAGIDLERRSTQ